MYWNKYCLLNSKDGDINSVEENCPLYTLEYILIKNKLFDIPLENYIESCRVPFTDGLYHQRPTSECPVGEYMSHDQLTTFIIFSYISDHCIHEYIWDEIKRQKFQYNDWKDGTLRLLHPRDIIFYGILCGSKLWYLFYPLLVFIMLFETFGTHTYRPQFHTVVSDYLKTGIWYQHKIKETSTKILWFVRTKRLFPKTFKLLTWWINLTSEFKTWYSIFETYFNKDHPIVKEIKE